MIDFRYHLTSLIAVFLALAVGIVLGSGPITQAVRDKLDGRAAEAEAQNATLTAELDAQRASALAADSLLTEASGDLVAGSLDGRNIALVTVGTQDATALDALVQTIGEAGATVSASVALTDSWTTSQEAGSRQSYASSLAEYLAAGADPAGYDATLGHALVLALSGAADDSGSALAPAAGVVLEILQRGGLVTATQAPTVPADAMVFLVDDAAIADAQAAAVLAATVGAVGADTEGAVVIARSQEPGALISTLRATNPAGVGSLVDSALASTPAGRIVTVRAANLVIAGQSVALDLGNLEDSLPSAVSVSPPDRTGLAGLGVESDTGSGQDATDQGGEDS